MPARRNMTQLWIGMVEVRSLSGSSRILGNTGGAFVNFVTWASDAVEYKRKVDLVIGDLDDLFVSEVVNSEPVRTRRTRIGGRLGDDIEDIISRAEENPNAIIYGAFHTFERDDA